MEQGVADALHYTTGAQVLAAASLHPQRSRYWQTATLAEEVTTVAAQVVWGDERVAGLHERGAGVIGLDEKPNIHALARAVPRQVMQPGPIERREVEYTRPGTVTFLVAFNVYDGTMPGWGRDKNAPAHLLWCVRQGDRHDRRARRLHLIMDNGGSHSDHHPQAYFVTPPRLRAVYTPAHARWLNQAQLRLRAFTAKYRDRFDCQSRQQLVDPLKASWPEYTRRFAHPFPWSWPRRHWYAWAEKKGATICTKTYATVH